MAENFIQLPADGSGKRLRTLEQTISGQVVQTQYVAMGAAPTYYVWVNDIVLAQNKHWLTIANLTGSGKVVKLRKLFLQNLALAAVTGVAIRLDMFKAASTAVSAGTAVTAETMDSADGAAPAQTAIKIATGATVSANGARLFAYATNSDEVGATNAFPTSNLQAFANLLAEGAEVRELVLREGEAVTLQQITSTIVGTFGVLAVITIE